MLTEVEATWLGCAIDSEGSISIVKASRRIHQSTYIPIVVVSNVNPRYVARTCELMRKSCGVGAICKCAPGVNYPITKAQVANQRACKVLLTELLPYLIIKRKRAEAVLAWIEVRAEMRKRRPFSGGGTPYGKETEDAVKLIRSLRLDD